LNELVQVFLPPLNLSFEDVFEALILLLFHRIEVPADLLHCVHNCFGLDVIIFVRFGDIANFFDLFALLFDIGIKGDQIV